MSGRYTLDGEPIDLEAFLSERADLDPRTVADIRGMPPAHMIHLPPKTFASQLGGAEGRVIVLRHASVDDRKEPPIIDWSRIKIGGTRCRVCRRETNFLIDGACSMECSK